MVLLRDLSAFPASSALEVRVWTCCLKVSLPSKYTPSYLNGPDFSEIEWVPAFTPSRVVSSRPRVKCKSSDFVGSKVIPTESPQERASWRSFWSWLQFDWKSEEIATIAISSAYPKRRTGLPNQNSGAI